MFFNPPPPPPTPPRMPVILGFVSDRAAVSAGEPVELIWSVEGVETVRLEPLGQEVPARGRLKVRPTVSTTYWLTATSQVGGETRPLKIDVHPAKAPMKPGPVSAVKPENPAEGGAWIQFASFQERPRAEAWAQALAEQIGQEPVVREGTLPNGQVMMRVRLGPYPGVPEALRTLRSLTPKLRGLATKPFVTIR